MDVEQAVEVLNQNLWNTRTFEKFAERSWEHFITIYRHRGESGEYEIWKPKPMPEGKPVKYDASMIVRHESPIYICGEAWGWTALRPPGVGGRASMCMKVSEDIEDIIRCITQLNSFAPIVSRTWGIAMDLSYLHKLGLIAELHDTATIRVQKTHIPYVDHYYSADFMWNYTLYERDDSRPEMLVKSDGEQWIVEGKGELVDASAPGHFPNLRELAFTLEKTLNRPRFSDMERRY